MSNLSTHTLQTAQRKLVRFLFHAEKAILRDGNALRTLCNHPRKVVGRKARQFYARQLFLHRIHGELLTACQTRFPSLSTEDQSRLIAEVDVLRAMQLRLAESYFRFLNRHRTEPRAVQPAPIARIA